MSSKLVRIFWKVFFYGLGGFILFLILINLGVFGSLPSLKELENPSITLATEVFAEDGTPMGKYYKDKGNRSNVEFKDISPNVVNALVATEDERFYEHSGIDGFSVMRAVLKLGRDGGGSTITQQLAKNLLDQGSRNFVRRFIEKLKEWIIAIKLERNFTKQELLALYLNEVPFGDNVYGIRNASRTFFQKEPDRLSVDEAAVLIGMLKGNTLYNPRKNPKMAIERRNTVINQMVKNKYLNEAEAAKLKTKPIDLSNYKKVDENNGLSPYFRDVLRSDLQKWCKLHKNPATGEPYNLYTDGLKVYTTINPRMQIYADEAVAKQLPILQRNLSAQYDVRKGLIWKDHQNILEAAMRNSDRWHNLEDDGLTDAAIRKTFNQPVPMKVFAWNSKREKDTVMTPLDSIKYHQSMLQTAFMVMDPVTGAVKAWVGGIDFKTYKFDHVNINTKRQVGSSIKPFLYSLGIEDFNFTPETECQTSQQYFPGFGYVPARPDKHEGGTMTMASGLAWSINGVAAYIMKTVGPKRFAEYIKQIGIPTKIDPYPSMALGTCDLSLYEMMWGYTMFPSGGYSTKPFYISRIEDKNGNVLDRFDTERKEVISQGTAYTMARMMQGPVDFGTAAGLRTRLGISEMGGKTGTTNDNADAWFMGYTPQLMAGSWIGCDDRFIHLEGGLGYGAQAARPIWEYFFAKVLADRTLGIDRQAKFIQPENVRKEMMYDYMQIEKTAPPGAEGGNQGNGKPNQYIDTSPPTVPVDSRLSPEEQKILQEANRTSKEGSVRITVTDADKKPQEPPKKKGFFKRLFGKKDKE
ncbi:MAG TPA: transglycosylase domain-containing protein [Puia sp.]|uniref:penicillin-binding protein 1A n=1 Tax=Puia sp. TaxID=2045100 RepID=UPI002B68272D|nr:transglycosylase domain-containing protein [Puia sp.]HVU95849.1 transglycosylase domain-containing protein [Puia sp.]